VRNWTRWRLVESCYPDDGILTARQEFLGRPPNADAFTKELFGDAAVASSKSADV
jgi:hypothetical protein